MRNTQGQDSSASVASPPPGATTPTRKTQAMLGVKLLVVLVIIAAPALLASPFVVGLTGVAFFGVMAATFGWLEGGVKVGAAVVSSLSILGAISIMLVEHIWLLTLILVGLGVLYGYAASKGLGKIVLQLPILTPYFMMDAPPLFTDPPVVGPGYALSVVVVMMAMGLWAVLVLHLAMGKRPLKRVDVADPRMALVYGTLLGVLSAGVMLLGTMTELKSHWVWVILTLYVLADPTNLFTRKKMLGRILGTLAGFGVVSVLSLVGVPDAVMQALALPALWCCVFFMLTKKPYWEYTLFLTVTVVLLNSSDVDTLLLDAERVGFTIIGALLSVLAALLVNLLHYRRGGIAAPTVSRAP